MIQMGPENITSMCQSLIREKFVRYETPGNFCNFSGFCKKTYTKKFRNEKSIMYKKIIKFLNVEFGIRF